MATRMDKYQSNNSNEKSSRTSRNRQLYDDIYTDTSYSNSIVLDDSKEVDINKIKELLDKERKEEEKKKIRPTIDLYKELSNLKDDAEEKIYDINEVLKEAKSKRDILEEASEKKKMYSENYKSRIDIEEELAKTKKVYDKLLQEETELLDIMNTLTNVNTNENKEDTYKDLTTEANKYNTGKVDTKQLEPVSEKQTEEYSTDTFMFNKKDFVSSKDDDDDDDEYDEDEEEGMSAFTKLMFVLLVIVVLLAAYYFINKYVLK